MKVSESVLSLVAALLQIRPVVACKWSTGKSLCETRSRAPGLQVRKRAPSSRLISPCSSSRCDDNHNTTLQDVPCLAHRCLPRSQVIDGWKSALEDQSTIGSRGPANSYGAQSSIRVGERRETQWGLLAQEARQQQRRPPCASRQRHGRHTAELKPFWRPRLPTPLGQVRGPSESRRQVHHLSPHKVQHCDNKPAAARAPAPPTR